MSRSRKILIVIIVVFLSLSIFVSCHSDKSNHIEKQKGIKTITVKPEGEVTRLYFSGSVRPIKVHNVVSPVAGAVRTLDFDFGQRVKKGQSLLTVVSQELAKNYHAALTNYLSTKQKYSVNNTIMSGTTFLYKDGLISRNEYLNALSNLQVSRLDLIRARVQLETLLKLTHLKQSDIEILTIGQSQQVEKALDQPIRYVRINSPANGVTLIPFKSGSGGSKKIDVGSEVKVGQALLTIGDMSGISLTVKVGEIDINKITIGLKAIVTSPAFPKFSLHGHVTQVSAQASQGDSSGLPSFPVEVVVPHLTKKEQQQIHVGMTAKVELIISKPKTISVPISAVFQKNGRAMVKILDKGTGQMKDVAVKTGTVSMESVTILSGLQAGDKVVISH